MAPIKDMTGKRFGRLKVTARAAVDAARYRCWRCRCDCGGTATVRGTRLRNGTTRSCGCLRREHSRRTAALYSAERVTHGCAKTAEYNTWCKMIARCFDPRADGFEYYGGKGISVADRWLGSDGFANFLTDVGKRPSPDLALRRIDKQGDFEPQNCLWASRGRGDVSKIATINRVT